MNVELCGVLNKGALLWLNFLNTPSRFFASLHAKTSFTLAFSFFVFLN